MYSLDHDVGNLEDENGNYVRHLMSNQKSVVQCETNIVVKHKFYALF